MNHELFANLNPPIIYIVLSGLVAVLIWMEGQMLKKRKGKLPKSFFFYASSLVDSIWFVVSMGAMYFIDLPTIALSVPTAYGIYTLAGWVYGTRLIKQQDMPSRPDKIIIPKQYLAFSQSFALIFFLLCLFVLSTLISPKSM